VTNSSQNLLFHFCLRLLNGLFSSDFVITIPLYKEFPGVPMEPLYHCCLAVFVQPKFRALWCFLEGLNTLVGFISTTFVHTSKNMEITNSHHNMNNTSVKSELRYTNTKKQLQLLHNLKPINYMLLLVGQILMGRQYINQ
jgi:hypothetical protein